MDIIIENDKKVSEYADGIFETILIEDNTPIFFGYHFDRFTKGLKEYLNISLKKKEKDELKSLLLSYVNKGAYGWRFVYSQGSIYISYRKIDPLNGNSLTVSGRVINSREKQYLYKTTNYKKRLEDLAKVRNIGYIDNIYLNENGFITSTSIANIFFVKDKEIYTPPIEEGVLNGTIRKIIAEKYKLEEMKIKVSDIENFDFSFITNSLIGLKLIEKINSFKFKVDNDLWQELSDYYRERILKEKEGNFIG